MLDFLIPVKSPFLSLTDAATVTTDPATAHRFKHSGSTARTFSGPGTGGYDGQQIVYELHNSGAGAISHTFTTTAAAGNFAFGSDITAIPSLAAGKRMYVTCIYSGGAQRWQIVGISNGY